MLEFIIFTLSGFLFALTLKITGITHKAIQSLEDVKQVSKILANQALCDDEKQAAAQKATISLLRDLAVFLLIAIIAFALAAIPPATTVVLGIFTYGDIIAQSLSLSGLVAACLGAGIIFLIKW